MTPDEICRRKNSPFRYLQYIVCNLKTLLLCSLAVFFSKLFMMEGFTACHTYQGDTKLQGKPEKPSDFLHHRSVNQLYFSSLNSHMAEKRINILRIQWNPVNRTGRVGVVQPIMAPMPTQIRPERHNPEPVLKTIVKYSLIFLVQPALPSWIALETAPKMHFFPIVWRYQHIWKPAR